MAVSYINAGTPGTTSATLPASSTSGDMVICVAYRAGSATAPTLPANWTQILVSSGGSNSTRIGYRIYDGAWSMPTWTNATRVVSFTVRSGGSGIAIGQTNTASKSQSNIVWDTVTPQTTDGTSFVVRGVVHTRPDATIGTPSGHTLIDATGTQPGYGTFRKNSSTDMNTVTVTISRNTTYNVTQFEVKELQTIGATIASTFDLTATADARVPATVSATIASTFALSATAAAARIVPATADSTFSLSTTVSATNTAPTGFAPSDYRQISYIAAAKTSADFDSLSWDAGDLITIIGGIEAGSSATLSPSVTGLTFTEITGFPIGGSAFQPYISAWSAAPTSSGSGTITVTATSSAKWGASLWVWPGSGGIGDTAGIASTSAQTAVSLTVSNGSGVIVLKNDGNGSAQTYTGTPSGANEQFDSWVTPDIGAWVADWRDQTGGTRNYGVTSSIATADSIGAVEILGPPLPGPQIIDYQEIPYDAPSPGAGTGRSFASVSWQTGDLLTIYGITEDVNSLELDTPTVSGLTFAAVSGFPLNTTSNCFLGVWSATAASDGSGAILVPHGVQSSTHWGASLWVWRDHGGIGTTASSQSGGSAATLSLTVGADSAVIYGKGDWSASAAGLTGTPTVNIEREDLNDPGRYSIWVGDYLAQSAGTRGYGTTASSGKDSAGAIEILAATITNVEGTVDETLANFTSTASGTEEISGTVAQTLQNFSSSVTAVETFSGSLDETLDSFTGAAAGTETISGALAETLDDFTASTSGTVVANLTGTVDETLDNFTSTASGTETISGSSARTLQDFLSSTSGEEVFSGSLSETLENATSTASGQETISGTSARTLQNFTSTASGTETLSGSAAITLQNFTSAVSGTETISGSAAVTLQNFFSTTSGTVVQPGIAGSLDETLDSFTGAASGDVTQNISGSVATTLADFTSTASAVETISGSSAQTLQNFTGSATGLEQITGSAAPTLQSFTSTAAGTEELFGSLNETLDNFTSQTSAQEILSGTVDRTLQNFLADSTAGVEFTGTVAQTLQNFSSTSSGTSVNNHIGTVAAVLDNFTAQAFGTFVPLDLATGGIEIVRVRQALTPVAVRQGGIELVGVTQALVRAAIRQGGIEVRVRQTDNQFALEA